MKLIKRFLKTSAVGLFSGVAYYWYHRYFAKGQNLNIQPIEASPTDEAESEIHEKLVALNDISSRICSQINLSLSKEPMKKSLSSTVLSKLNNSTTPRLRGCMFQSLSTLSTYTKNEQFLNHFISSEGIQLLFSLIASKDFENYADEEIRLAMSDTLANLSQRKESLTLLGNEAVQPFLISLSNERNNIILSLNFVKIMANVSNFDQNRTYQSTIFSPDIYLLDQRNHINHKKEYDVVFINGMLGSVFFTWRQHDEEVVDDDSNQKTKCWPRDWLSASFPDARVVGVNALLRPFIWNEMSNIDKLNRSIEKRATELSSKLEMAGIGRRPIIWITHSAGGILLKHILHLCQSRPLASATRGILFMSTPHSGAQSMFGLYYFPFKYFLTPEAKHLETNSKVLLDLNDWFKEFIRENNVSILTLTETEPTRISKFYSTVIVPKCDGEFDEHEELMVKSNHLYISKPRNKSDESYVAVVDFIERVIKSANQK